MHLNTRMKTIKYFLLYMALAASDLHAASLALQAERFAGMSTRNFVGTAHGRLACAASVDVVVASATGYKFNTKSTAVMFKQLRTQKTWKQVSKPVAGAIVITPTGISKRRHGHVGIVGSDGRTIYSNSSKLRKFVANYDVGKWKKRFGKTYYFLHV